MLLEVCCLFLVALLWGVTNPLLKLGSRGIEDVGKTSHGRIHSFLVETAFLFLRWKYLLPFLVNQLGSVLFYYTVSTGDVSLVSPVANSLTLVVTAVAGRILLNEEALPLKSYIGMACILCGVTFCVWSKTTNSA